MGAKTEFRYERKFFLDLADVKAVQRLVHHLPQHFTEVFHERQINNIYFDNDGLEAYYDNVEGERERVKTRIRWYGSLFGIVEKPVLEFKIKRGFMGTKKSFKMAPFTLSSDFSREHIAASASGLPAPIKTQLLSLKPTLLNYYKRRYFLSDDKRFRITLDYSLGFYGIRYGYNSFLNHYQKCQGMVVELKYNKDCDPEANDIASRFPFRLTKSSKYVQGIEHVLL